MKLDRRTMLGGLAATPLAGMLPGSAFAQKAGINYWHHFTSTTEFKGLERVIALFKQKYPDIAVTQENIPNPEYMSKMTAAVVANSKPDTCMVVAERANDLVAMGGAGRPHRQDQGVAALWRVSRRRPGPAAR